MSKKLPLILSLGALVLTVACAHQGAGYGGGAGLMAAYPYDDCVSSRYDYWRYAAGPYAPYAYSPIGYGPCGYYRTQISDVYGGASPLAARQAVTLVRRSAHPRLVRRPDGPSSRDWPSPSSTSESPSSAAAVARAPVAPVSPPAPAPAPRVVAPRG